MEAYISKLKFNTGDSIEIQKNDIVVFVGPNNAGKSQSLKDIFSKTTNTPSKVVIFDIEVKKEAVSLQPLLDRVAVGRVDGNGKRYNGFHLNTRYEEGYDEYFQNNPYYWIFGNLFVSNLDTEARLTICNPPTLINRNAPKTHPIHFAAFDQEYRKWLTENFKKAFNVDVTPNTWYGQNIPLCIGELIRLGNEFEDEQTRQERYAEILATYPQVQNQGDGIKSFTGILLYLMLDYYTTYLIDEPESFLHPPQAKIMGQILGNALKENQQAFISTHSEEIIKGLLESCPNRVKIIRITRDGNKNAFSILSNEQLQTLWSDPLLKYSNIMSSLFHKTVVLCESDSDCKLYSIIDNYLKQKTGQYSETLFLHCGGKHRMAKIASALKALQIDVRLIPDLDALNNQDVFKGIIEAFGMKWNTVEKDYKTIEANLHSQKEAVSRSGFQTALHAIVTKSTTHNPKDEFTAKELEEIRNLLKVTSKWQELKKSGISAIPKGDAFKAFKKLNETLREHGIFLVPVGELEGFIKEVGGHGPEWVNNVLEQYPDLEGEEYSEIKKFISSVNL